MKTACDLSKAIYGDVINVDYSIAILPWGAIEPHNYHLPYATDCILSQRISMDAAHLAAQSGINAMVLPPVTFGSQNPGQRELPFCIHGRYSTQFAILTDIVSSLHYQGIKKLLIVNGHGGNSFKNMIRDLAVDYPDFMLASCEWFKITNFEHLIENVGEHADEVETSVMMYYHPELVQLSKAGDGQSQSPRLKPLAEGVIWMPRNWSEISIDTGIGNPHMSSAQKGEDIVLPIINKLSQIMVDMANHK